MSYRSNNYSRDNYYGDTQDYSYDDNYSFNTKRSTANVYGSRSSDLSDAYSGGAGITGDIMEFFSNKKSNVSSRFGEEPLYTKSPRYSDYPNSRDYPDEWEYSGTGYEDYESFQNDGQGDYQSNQMYEDRQSGLNGFRGSFNYGQTGRGGYKRGNRGNRGSKGYRGPRGNRGRGFKTRQRSRGKSNESRGQKRSLPSYSEPISLDEPMSWDDFAAYDSPTNKKMRVGSDSSFRSSSSPRTPRGKQSRSFQSKKSPKGGDAVQLEAQSEEKKTSPEIKWEEEFEPKTAYFYCMFCKVDLPNSQAQIEHLKSADHPKNVKARIKFYRSLLVNIKQEASDLAYQARQMGKELKYCSICGLEYTGKYSEHNASKLHKGMIYVTSARCAYCNMNFTRRFQYEKHTNGIQHARNRRYKLMEEGHLVDDFVFPEESEDKILGDQYVVDVRAYYCKLCNEVSKARFPPISEHCKSKQHFDNYKTYIEEKKAAEEKKKEEAALKAAAAASETKDETKEETKEEEEAKVAEEGGDEEMKDEEKEEEENEENNEEDDEEEEPVEEEEEEDEEDI